ncbi:MAG TPA: 4Fe-4S dicluster domain-containing protein [Acidobacteriota bacterium]|jgi:Fe-S-cluster-containing dehydrogenase component
MSEAEFFVDPQRCIGCHACETACAECGTHKGLPMIHVDYVDRSRSTQTVPMVCMHCEDPACAQVCPAYAIQKTADGVVHSATTPRCIGCSNCVLACPFGVPKYMAGMDLMMKCDMCYDRTSIGKRPMCATVCPTGALWYGSREQLQKERRSVPVNQFRFGGQLVRTRVHVMVHSGETLVQIKGVNLRG